MRGASGGRFRVVPLTPARWPDLERLFGPRGACGGCWCMTPRLARAEYLRQRGEANRKALRALVAGGAVPGVLAYAGEEPVGWCALGPRDQYPRLARSRVCAAVDDMPVWSIPCLFVHPRWRRQGVSVALLTGAVRHARRAGACAIEGYPIEPRQAAVPPVFAWTGLASGFRRAGFVEVARRSPARPVMRYGPRRGIRRRPARAS